MVRPYSLDLRERVISALETGDSCRAVASRFDLAVSTVVKWGQRYRKTGSVAPGKYGGHKRHSLEPHRALVHRLVCGASGPGPVRELREALAEHGIELNAEFDTARFLHAEGLSFKKKRVRPGAGTGLRSPAAAPVGDVIQRSIDPGRLVFVDETWTKTNMAPLRGMERQRKAVDRQGARMGVGTPTLLPLPPLRSDRVDAPCLFDGPINGERFPRMGRAGVGPDPTARRCRHPRQSRKPQGKGRPKRHSQRRRTHALPARLQPRPEHHRATLRKTQTLVKTTTGQKLRHPMQRNRTHPRSHHTNANAPTTLQNAGYASIK